ncbi:hypothetical protein SDC9_72509 [bioreactor metagenome]|uniref:Uncharacterized protein n=1 Tax=bioreactor metagenome TaxID=1076179 RepID=A0A644YDI3_9ZZZZ
MRAENFFMAKPPKEKRAVYRPLLSFYHEEACRAISADAT